MLCTMPSGQEMDNKGVYIFFDVWTSARTFRLYWDVCTVMFLSIQ